LGTVANLSLWPEKALNLCTTEGEFLLLLLLIIIIIISSSIIKLLQHSVHTIHCTNLSSYLTFLHNTAALREKTPNSKKTAPPPQQQQKTEEENPTGGIIIIIIIIILPTKQSSQDSQQMHQIPSNPSHPSNYKHGKFLGSLMKESNCISWPSQ
jgi:hypothetical protein